MLSTVSGTGCAAFRESSSCEADPACYSATMRIGCCLHWYFEHLSEVIPTYVLHLVESYSKLVSDSLVRFENGELGCWLLSVIAQQHDSSLVLVSNFYHNIKTQPRS